MAMMFANASKSVISLAVWRKRATRDQENADSFGALQAPQGNSTVTESSKSLRVEALEELIGKLPLSAFNQGPPQERLEGSTFHSAKRLSVHLSKSDFLLFKTVECVRAGIDGTGLPVPSERTLTASHASLRCHNDRAVTTFSTAEGRLLRRAVNARLEELRHEAEIKLRERMTQVLQNPLQVKWKQTQGLGGKTYFEAKIGDANLRIVEGPPPYWRRRLYTFSGSYKNNLLQDVAHTVSDEPVSRMVARIRAAS